MKFRFKIKSYVEALFPLGLALYLGGASLGFAADPTRTTWFEDGSIDPASLEIRATQILQYYDPKGIVWVEATSQTLPARPDSPENLIQSVEIITNKQQKYKILVFTSLPALPADFMKTLRAAISAPIDLKKIIAVPAQPVTPAEARSLADKGQALPEGLVRQPASDIKTDSVAIDVKDAQFKASSKPSWLGAFEDFSGVIYLIVGFCAILMMNWGLRKLASGINQIPSALKAMQLSNNQPQPMQVDPRFNPVGARSGDVISNDAPMIDLDLQATLALFVDLIRNNKLGELKYYWDHTPFALKREVMVKMSLHRLIFQQLSQTFPTESERHLDPAYLTSSMQDLDVDPVKLGQIVAQDSSKFLNLSGLQRENLKLPILERLRLFESYEPQIGEAKFYLSPEEESVLAAQSSWNRFWVKSCVSLVTFKALPKNLVVRILASQNALTLARVWDLPSALKTELAESIPADKLSLIQFYQGKEDSKVPDLVKKQILATIHSEIVREYEQDVQNQPKPKLAA